MITVLIAFSALGVVTVLAAEIGEWGVRRRVAEAGRPRWRPSRKGATLR